MTDVSSKGLLPQLTDVLYALTDSQELLLFTLQALRRQQNDVARVTIGQSFRTHPVQTQPNGHSEFNSPALVDTRLAENNGVHRAFLIDDVVRTTELERPSSLERDMSGFVAEVDTLRVAEEKPAETEPETDSTPRGPSEVVPHGIVTAAAPAGAVPSSVPIESLANVSVEPTDDEDSAERNYNFFDELDARLTDIKTLNGGSVEQGSL